MLTTNDYIPEGYKEPNMDAILFLNFTFFINTKMNAIHNNEEIL